MAGDFGRFLEGPSSKRDAGVSAVMPQDGLGVGLGRLLDEPQPTRLPLRL